jgi:cytochrome c oxidase subunit 2
MRLPCRALAAAVALAPLIGCTGVQSVLSPQGPRAAEIAQLGWLLFIGGTVILAAVLAALALAIGGSARMRAGLADERTVIAGGL